jgi:hypothetical protein
MGTNEITLEGLRSLASTIDARGINLLLGAGISRDAPTCGPIWTEMQVGFLDAVFDRMAAAGWSAAAAFPAQREKVRGFVIRPELFWREMISKAGEDVIWKALTAAGIGPPNANHARVAALLKNRRCKWALTTNFDEHVEAFIANDVAVAVPTGETGLSDSDASTYVKLHGSLGAGHTLSYTLEHYDKLTQRHERLLRTILPGRPLVIAGYSGYDTDVLPVLRGLADQFPWAVVVRHPGSPGEQPILGLAANGSRAYVLESTCPQALAVLADGLDVPAPVRKPAPVTRDPRSWYADAVGDLEMPTCPYLIMSASQMVGAWMMVRSFAWLTHDALADSRDQPSLPDEVYQQIHRELARNLRFAGDSGGARIMLNEAAASVDKSGMGAYYQPLAEAIVRDAPSRVGDDEPMPPRFPGKPSEIITAFAGLTGAPGGLSKRQRFEMSWMLGTTRRREGNPSQAIEAFNQAATLFMEDMVTHLERGRFLLDWGGAVFEHGAKLQDDRLAQEAYKILQRCRVCTEESGDWPTNAQAHLMIAKLFTLGGGFTQAWQSIDVARTAAGKTGDAGLLHRINEWANALDDLQKRHG